MRTIHFSVIEIEPGSFHPVLKASLDGLPITLIIDTGASRTVIDQSLVVYTDRIVVPENEIFAAGVNAQKLDVKQVLIKNFRIGRFSLDEFTVFSTDLMPISEMYQKVAGVRIDGLLGCDFLETYQAVINFPKKIIKLHKHQ